MYKLQYVSRYKVTHVNIISFNIICQGRERREGGGVRAEDRRHPVREGGHHLHDEGGGRGRVLRQNVRSATSLCMY